MFLRGRVPTALGFAFILSVITQGMVAAACPVQMDVDRVAWIELKSTPSDTPMDLVSFYDRTSSLQLFTLGLLFVLMLAAAALIVERAIYYYRAGRQARLFISLANDALFQARAHDVTFLSARFRLSPVACVVNASLRTIAADVQYSAFGRHIAETAQVERVVRGLATLGAIAMTTPIVGAALAVQGLIRWLRVSTALEISADVLQRWIADWLIGLLISLVLAFVATWAHRLLSATANRMLLEMDRLSLAFISRIASSTHRSQNAGRLLVPATAEIRSFATRPL
ncbi:MAG TPA: hypothetical protein VNS63_23590 [Blastocatellia bacterium]|nr:hypothetical protein [Blastocatellia bacterium]